MSNVPAPMCGASRVEISGMLAHVMSTTEKKERTPEGRRIVEVHMPFSTYSTLKILERFRSLTENRIAVAYGCDMSFEYVGCKLESVVIKAKVGERIDVSMDVSYSRKKKRAVMNEVFYQPERVLIWDDLAKITLAKN